LILEYDSARTRTAAEAYEARSGNCLSLVIMTAAMARAMGVPVRFQSVHVDDSWSRSGDLYVASGHVNLALGRRSTQARTAGDIAAEMVIDFLPSAELRGQRSLVISETTVVAMYLNNRAAETLAAGALDEAYWWVREALLQGNGLPAAYNTLGVIYLRHGQPQRAQAALEEALRLDPNNTHALANLVPALKVQGFDGAAAAAAARLAQLEGTAPFHWFNAGLAAMGERDYLRARDFFRRELQRDPDYHELHFWLAQAEAGLGNVAQARTHLERAARRPPPARIRPCTPANSTGCVRSGGRAGPLTRRPAAISRFRVHRKAPAARGAAGCSTRGWACRNRAIRTAVRRRRRLEARMTVWFRSTHEATRPMRPAQQADAGLHDAARPADDDRHHGEQAESSARDRDHHRAACHRPDATERRGQARPERALILGLAFPVGWGLWNGWKRRKLSWMAVLGVVSTLLTGGIG